MTVEGFKSSNQKANHLNHFKGSLTNNLGDNELIKIISPDEYRTIPWKNGKGETVELAINEGGSLDYFEWRFSIASVTEDGEFSDFTGYMRNLVLIKGEGIDLCHDNVKTDRLETALSVATFDGSCKTVGTLKNGPIKDFNLMSSVNQYTATVDTYQNHHQVSLNTCELCFVYALKNTLTISSLSPPHMRILSPNHLLQISEYDMRDMVITGQNMIVIHLNAV